MLFFKDNKSLNVIKYDLIDVLVKIKSTEIQIMTRGLIFLTQEHLSHINTSLKAVFYIRAYKEIMQESKISREEQS